MNIEKIEINKLKPATYNPRQISKKQYNDLKDSIEKFGLVDPIIINKDFTVIGGHQRLKVCKELKYKDIDCVVLDLTKEEERELNIRLNKSVKGGEEDNVVILPDLTTNTQLAYERNNDDENRLFYVGATRAKEHLHIVRPKDENKAFPMGEV